MSSPFAAIGLLVGVADIPHPVYIQGDGPEPPVLMLPQGESLEMRRRLLADWLVKNS